MTNELVLAYRKLINKHFAAVQTDTLLGECDNDDNRYFKLEKRAKLFWEEFRVQEADFIARLESANKG